MISLLKEKRHTQPNRGYGIERPRVILQSTAEALLGIICSFLGVSKEDVKSKDRGAKLVKARAVFSYLGREYGLSTLTLGEAINRNHTNITYHSKRYKDYLDESKPWFNKELKEEIDKINNRLLLNRI